MDMSVQDFRQMPYTYVSSKAGCDPCRTVFLCAPGEYARTAASAEAFAVSSGWKEMAEERAAVLIVPVVPDGWEREDTGLLLWLYQELRGSFRTRSGEAIWGRSGMLWCWETVLYAAGYEDGAVFAGNVLVRYPGLFAAAALVNGVPSDYSAAEERSCHWLVPHVSEDYQVKNREVPVHLWMLGGDRAGMEQARQYFSGCFGARTVSVCADGGRVTASQKNGAQQVRVFEGVFGPEYGGYTGKFMRECFEHVIRWKNGPDGTLSLADSREEFYENPRFLRRSVQAGGRSYDYFVHLPGGRTQDEVRGLPLVFTVHGRGEPAWMFTTKNGWDTLADETGEFVLVSPDSPGNIWFLPRDGEAFPAMVQAVTEEFGTDAGRVYLTGFSNGGMIVREVAVKYPQLFAGVSLWNAPAGNTGAMMRKDSSEMAAEFDGEFSQILRDFLEGGWEMPCAFLFGDQDGAARADRDLMIRPMLEANGCVPAAEPCGNGSGCAPAAVHCAGDEMDVPGAVHCAGDETDVPGAVRCAGDEADVPDAVRCAGGGVYTPEKGYEEGGRFSTICFRNRAKETRVTVTVMKNMPHGAIRDESRAVWEFLRRFRRVDGNRRVVIK